MQPCTSPELKRGSQARFTSSLPNFWMSSAAPAWRPTTIIRLGSAREIICRYMPTISDGSPKPP